MIFVDQLRYLQKGTMGSVWTDRAIQESLKVRLDCGSRSYEYLRDNRWPLTLERILQNNIENVKFSPGTYPSYTRYNLGATVNHSCSNFAILCLFVVTSTASCKWHSTVYDTHQPEELSWASGLIQIILTIIFTLFLIKIISVFRLHLMAKNCTASQNSLKYHYRNSWTFFPPCGESCNI